MRKLVATAMLVALIGVNSAWAESVLISSEGSTEVGINDFAFDEGQMVEVDMVSGIASLFVDIFGDEEDIDGFATLANGHFLITTDDQATLPGVGAFVDGDIIDYNPLTGVGTLVVSELSLFGGNDGDVDGLAVLPDGKLVLSFDNAEVVGGTSYAKGDMIIYDPLTGDHSLFFAGSNFDDEDLIDAIYVRANGNILFSTDGNTSLNGVDIKDGDIVEYNPLNGDTSIFFVEQAFYGFNNNQDINALDLGAPPVPEPTALVLGAFALVAFCWASRRMARA